MTKKNMPSGWTAVPHGLWTLACSDKAKLLAGWLWSHEDHYVEKLWLRRAAKELGWSLSTTQRTFVELETGGLIQIERKERGGSLRIYRDRDAWLGMCERIVGGVDIG